MDIIVSVVTKLKRHFLNAEKSSVQSLQINFALMFEYNIIPILRSPRDEDSDINES